MLKQQFLIVQLYLKVKKTATGILDFGSSNATISDCNISAKSNTTAYGILSESKELNASKCNIIVSTVRIGVGIANKGKMTISDISTEAFSNENNFSDFTYTVTFVSIEYKTSLDIVKSAGIYNSGTITINNCNATGSYAGVQTSGNTTINGSTYEGVVYGGILFFGNNSTSQINNVTLKNCTIPADYTLTETSQGGFSMARGSNMIIRMNNCNITGGPKSFIFENSKSEKNNTLYISNSKINTNNPISIKDATHKLYIGKGNNFTATNTDRVSSVITTSEEYK